jgi:hypothetical protein
MADAPQFDPDQFMMARKTPAPIQVPKEPAFDPDAFMAQKQEPSSPTTPEQTGFFGRIGENLNPVPLVKSMWPTALGGSVGPVQTLKNIVTPNPQVAQEAADAYNRGDYGRAAMSTVEDIPVVGPMIRQGEQDIRNKDYGALAGTAVSLALPSALGKVKARIPISSKLNPVEASAVRYGEQAQIPVNLGTATNNPFVRTSQEVVSKLPFTSGKAARLREAENQGAIQAGQNLAQSVAPTGTASRVAAGEGVESSLNARIAQQDAIADAAYTKLRQIADQNKQRVQVGQKPSGVLDQYGNPVMSPIYEDIALPTDTSAVKAKVQPVLAQLEKSIPAAQRQNSPGLTVLRQIMDRPAQVDINTALDDLRAIQNMARTATGDLPQVQGVSKGLAKMVIPDYRDAIDAAAAAGGPDATAALNAGRAATKAKYAANEVRGALPRNAMGTIEPGRIIDRLGASDEANLQLLKQVQQHTPQAIPSVARSILTEMVDDMTYQGDVRRAQTAVRAWHSIGDETKSILFPDPTIRQNITDFVNLAEMMGRRANPSGSGTGFAAIMGAMHPKMLLAQLMAGKPVTDMLFGPNGPAVARRGIPLSLGPIPAATGTVVGANQVLPRYARGGIIRKPTVGIVGEAGPEAILPVGAPPRIKLSPAQAPEPQAMPRMVKPKSAGMPRVMGGGQRSAKQRGAIFEAERKKHGGMLPPKIRL